MLALNNLVFTIEYDNNGNNKNNSSVDNSPFIPLLNDIIAPTNPMTTMNLNLIPASELVVSPIAQPVIFTIRNNDLHIIYNVEYIDFYKTNKNAVQFILNDKEIISQNYDDNNIIEQLLSILGLNKTSQLLLVVDTFTSTEKKKHTNYRLVNERLDTILILQKV